MAISVKLLFARKRPRKDLTFYKNKRLFGEDVSKYKDWTNEEDLILKNNYGIKNKKEIESILPNRSWNAIYVRASRLHVNSFRMYKDEEKSFIKDNYGKMAIEEISEKIGKPIDSIKRRVREFGIMEQEIWTDDEDMILKNSFGKFTVKHISQNILMNRSESSIYHRCQILGLSNSKKHYSKEYLLNALLQLSKALNKTPTCIDLKIHGLPSCAVYKRKFGSYHTACEKLELDLNATIYNHTKNYFSKNNDVCRSKAEQSITNFFIDNGVKYIIDGSYKEYFNIKEFGKKRYDWIVDDVAIEYFGLVKSKKYKDRMKFKIDLCSRNNIELIQIYEKDLYCLKAVFERFIKS